MKSLREVVKMINTFLRLNLWGDLTPNKITNGKEDPNQYTIQIQTVFTYSAKVKLPRTQF